jgi:hypothetical protein
VHHHTTGLKDNTEGGLKALLASCTPRPTLVVRAVLVSAAAGAARDQLYCSPWCDCCSAKRWLCVECWFLVDTCMSLLAVCAERCQVLQSGMSFCTHHTPDSSALHALHVPVVSATVTRASCCRDGGDTPALCQKRLKQSWYQTYHPGCTC